MERRTKMNPEKRLMDRQSIHLKYGNHRLTTLDIDIQRTFLYEIFQNISFFYFS